MLIEGNRLICKRPVEHRAGLLASVLTIFEAARFNT
jgi:hypothetical protein